MGGLEGGCSEELGAGRNTLKQEGRGRAVPPALRLHSIQLCLLPAAMPSGHSSPSAVPSEAHGRGNEAARVKKAVGPGTQQGLSEHQENPRVTASEAGPWTSCEGPAWQNLASESLPSSPETPDPSAQMQSQAGQHLFGPGLLTHHERGPDPEQLTAVPFGERLVLPAPVSAAPLPSRMSFISHVSSLCLRVLICKTGTVCLLHEATAEMSVYVLSVCVCPNMPTCVRACLHMCEHACMCQHVYTYVCPNMPTHMCEHAYTCVNMPACVNTSTHMCVRTCLHVCVSEHAYVCGHAYMCVNMSACLNMSTRMCVRTCLHVCVQTCLDVCACVCMNTSTCVRTWLHVCPNTPTRV